MKAETDNSTCLWQKAWIGRCGLAVLANGCCEEHQKKCASCEKPATHDCDETGQFVCGAPLCGDCEHTIFENGTNEGVGFNAANPPKGMKQHCRKTEQKYEPWYRREPSTTPAP